jgi:type IV pilus assembly protein PilM
MAFFGLFGNKQMSVLGVDIGASSLKVVQLRKQRGKALLETYGELALGPYAGVEIGQSTNLTADKISETLRDLLRESKVTTKECGVGIPFERSLLTLVELPRRKDREEQKTIIELEARKYIPVPISEVQLDWFIVPDISAVDAQKDKVRALLVAVHNDELKLLQTVVQTAELSASFFELEIFSTIRAVVDEPVKPIMVLDIGSATTKAYVVEHGVVALSHTITTGGQDATRAIAVSHSVPVAGAETLKKEQGITGEAKGGIDVRSSLELVYGRIFGEARRVLAQYELVHQKAVSSIILTGGGGVAKGLGAFAQSAFAITVKVADPFARTEAPEFIRPVLQEIGPEFAVAVGLALRKLEELR